MKFARTISRLLFACAVSASLCLDGATTAVAQTTAATSDAAAPYLAARAGDLLEVRIDQLLPTQPSIGYDQVYYKLGRYRADAKQKFDDYCEDNGQRGVERYDARRSSLVDTASFTCKQAAPQPGDKAASKLKTVVVGPGGKLYLTDGHHTISILRALPDAGAATLLRVRVTDNFSALGAQAFWQRMVAERKVWLKDENFKDISPMALPQRVALGALQDDPYRSLVYFTRGIGYEPPDDATEFLEFYWASWLRQSSLPELALYDLDDTGSYARAVGDTARKMVALDNDDEVFNGMKASELGKLKRFDPEGDLKKLTREGSANKPAGKLVHAVEYKRSLRAACTSNCR